MASIENNLKEELARMEKDVKQALTIPLEKRRFDVLQSICQRISGMSAVIINVPEVQEYWNKLWELNRKASNETGRIIDAMLERRHG